MKYNNIKKILKHHIENKIQSLWTFNEEKKEFVYLFERFDDDLQIYTPQQLKDYLENYEREKT